MIKLNKENIAISKYLCKLYISSKYETFASICKEQRVRHLNLTEYNARMYIHLAISRNLVSDEIAKQIIDKAICHSERKTGHRNDKTRKFYDKLLKERASDKATFPNGHTTSALTQKIDFKADKGEQISLI